MASVSGTDDDDGGKLCIRANVLAVLAERRIQQGSHQIRLEWIRLENQHRIETKHKMWSTARTEHGGVDCEDLGEGDVGEQREAAAGDAGWPTPSFLGSILVVRLLTSRGGSLRSPPPPPPGSFDDREYAVDVIPPTATPPGSGRGSASQTRREARSGGRWEMHT
ncbi:hypothetical protein GUJ93_ZPchr0004g40514 [Zizania palustris]|uniref:Uncharacterized protein n=1 Tax=Zizania palustris TaxID=103762 RepID=A0A8J5V8V5_ZIZPA|nr:hypothetical protein GUJ93_ZPchr0004g40514 [Zizania palustris]